MHYSLVHGVYTPRIERIAPVAGFLLPAAAVIFLALSLGSVSVFHANGKNPELSTKQNSTTQTTKTATSKNGSASNKTIGSTSTSTPTSTASSVSSGTSLPAGGYGGGGAFVPTTSSSSTPSGATISSTGLPPSGTTSVTVPAQDVSAAGKDIISTSPLTLTIN